MPLLVELTDRLPESCKLAIVDTRVIKLLPSVNRNVVLSPTFIDVQVIAPAPASVFVIAPKPELLGLWFIGPLTAKVKPLFTVSVTPFLMPKVILAGDEGAELIIG